MDGKSRQEIKKYILAFLALALCITGGSYVLSRHEESVKRNQIARLAESYPEMEADIIRIMEKSNLVSDREADRLSDKEEQILDRLEETYGHYYGRSIANHRVWILCIYCIAVAGAVFVLLWMASGRKRKLWENEAEEQQMKLEEALKEAHTHIDDLKEKYEMEEERTKALITNISHQLKTPLASLRMSHELTTSDYITEEERAEFAAQEEAEIDKLQRLLDELLKLSRLEKRMIQLKPERNSLRETISKAVSVVYPKARTKSIDIQVQMETDVVTEHDAHWTAEAFANILDNAVKYSPESTEITIHAKRLFQNVMIEFMDEGSGIPDEEKHRIYQRFYRGKNSGGVDGAGIGLYLARQILEEEGGSIVVKNRYPEGSVFQVLLPIDEAASTGSNTETTH